MSSVRRLLITLGALLGCIAAGAASGAEATPAALHHPEAARMWEVGALDGLWAWAERGCPGLDQGEPPCQELRRWLAERLAPVRFEAPSPDRGVGWPALALAGPLRSMAELRYVEGPLAAQMRVPVVLPVVLLVPVGTWDTGEAPLRVEAGKTTQARAQPSHEDAQARVEASVARARESVLEARGLTPRLAAPRGVGAGLEGGLSQAIGAGAAAALSAGAHGEKGRLAVDLKVGVSLEGQGVPEAAGGGASLTPSLAAHMGWRTTLGAETSLVAAAGAQVAWAGTWWACDVVGGVASDCEPVASAPGEGAVLGVVTSPSLGPSVRLELDHETPRRVGVRAEGAWLEVALLRQSSDLLYSGVNEEHSWALGSELVAWTPTLSAGLLFRALR